MTAAPAVSLQEALRRSKGFDPVRFAELLARQSEIVQDGVSDMNDLLVDVAEELEELGMADHAFVIETDETQSSGKAARRAASKTAKVTGGGVMRANTTKHYIARALFAAQGEGNMLDYADVTTAVVEMGWTTKSEKPSQTINQTLYAMRKDGFVSHNDEQLWTVTDSGIEAIQSLEE